MTRKQELEKTIAGARLKLTTLESKERQKENEQLIGKCFKYRNSHSLPEKESDYWWLYIKILSLNEYGICSGIAFQTDKDGRIDIETREYINLSSGYIEIPKKEFEEEWAELAMSIMSIEEKCINVNSKEAKK